ncbi:hypothetical protein FGO68_gene6309 [Halteria grandinella]|uniref:Uncharacterized protein n=1 Tax=Halteria grandinella TaxID=5974 RepID=A0A8J8NPM2_HALGN|nr:hypothetical protein FGO68_gene6309 [Halteria grandinella]
MAIYYNILQGKLYQYEPSKLQAIQGGAPGDARGRVQQEVPQVRDHLRPPGPGTVPRRPLSEVDGRLLRQDLRATQEDAG